MFTEKFTTNQYHQHILYRAMINPEEALALILQHAKQLNAVELKISAACGHVLAEDIVSPIDSPPFDQSAMDGYAVQFVDVLPEATLKVKGEVITGSSANVKIKSGQTIRVFTGAMIPEGADTVIMKEYTTLTGDKMTIINHGLQKGMHIRRRGSQVRKGALVLKQGHLFTPASVGYLAALGIQKVKAIRYPKVGIIATGSELQIPGRKLQPGQIYESNTIALEALLGQMKLQPESISRVKDREKLMHKEFKKAFLKSNVLLITGGISVGDYDYVAPVLKALGVEMVFHKVAQKPGKPFYFGTLGKKLVFALPGNPASVLTCFYEYVYPALNRMKGLADCNLRSAELKSKNSYSKKEGLTHFLKGYATDNEVEIMTGQESYLLNSYSRANCLVMLPGPSTGVKEGDKVNVQYISQI